MKNKKKHKKSVPDVHIQGDLEDVKKLVEIVSKKKSVVIFRNGNDGTCYADIEKIMVEYSKTDLTRLEKDFRIIYFDFFPVKKSENLDSVKKPVPAKPKPVKTFTGKAKTIKKASPEKTSLATRTSKVKK